MVICPVASPASTSRPCRRSTSSTASAPPTRDQALGPGPHRRRAPRLRRRAGRAGGGGSPRAGVGVKIAVYLGGVPLRRPQPSVAPTVSIAGHDVTCFDARRSARRPHAAAGTGATASCCEVGPCRRVLDGAPRWQGAVRGLGLKAAGVRRRARRRAGRMGVRRRQAALAVPSRAGLVPHTEPALRCAGSGASPARARSRNPPAARTRTVLEFAAPPGPGREAAERLAAPAVIGVFLGRRRRSSPCAAPSPAWRCWRRATAAC
jgi:hypothetical protein